MGRPGRRHLRRHRSSHHEGRRPRTGSERSTGRRRRSGSQSGVRRLEEHLARRAVRRNRASRRRGCETFGGLGAHGAGRDGCAQEDHRDAAGRWSCGRPLPLLLEPHRSRRKPRSRPCRQGAAGPGRTHVGPGEASTGWCRRLHHALQLPGHQRGRQDCAGARRRLYHRHQAGAAGSARHLPAR